MDAREFLRTLNLPVLLERITREEEARRPNHRYEEIWFRYLSKIATIAESGETSLSRVIDWLTFGESRKAFPAGLEMNYWLGKLVPMEPVELTARAMIARIAPLSAATRSDTDAVVELGSGTDSNLISFWVTSGPRNAEYHAYEMAEAGRLSTEALAKFDTSLSIHTHAFDYYHPDYSSLTGGSRHLLLFTCGSIEQIAELPREAIAGLLDKAEAVSGVHLEPVGWQMTAEADLDEIDRKHRQRCAKYRYNRNLWGLLNDLQNEGLIRIDRTIRNLTGRPNHPATLICWTKVG